MAGISKQDFLLQRLEAGRDYFGFPQVQIEVLSETPHLVVMVVPQGGVYEAKLDVLIDFLARQTFAWKPSEPHLLYRSVDLERLSQVIKTGCDVEPTDSCLFAADAKKALDYGRYSKVVQAFNPAKLDPNPRVIFLREAKNHA